MPGTDRDIYRALGELLNRYESLAVEPPVSDRPLTGYEHRVFSQNGEDGVIAELLRRVGIGPRWFIEFGIETGVEGNCVFLADVLGWSGLFMEAELDRSNELRRKYRGMPKVHTDRALVNPDNVERLFAAVDVPREPDLLSIDVDGNDYWVWAAITAYSPRIVVIEYNPHLDPFSRLVQPLDLGREWNGTDNYGASLGALISLGETKGYRLVHTELTGNNAFFVRRDIAGVLPNEDVVPIRAPNFFLTGEGHPTDPHGHNFLDLDAAVRNKPAPTP